jgi:hypothetical protein
MSENKRPTAFPRSLEQYRILQQGLQKLSYDRKNALADICAPILDAGIRAADMVDALDGIEAKVNGRLGMVAACLRTKVDAALKVQEEPLRIDELRKAYAFLRQIDSAYSGNVNAAHQATLNQALLEANGDYAVMEKRLKTVLGERAGDYGSTCKDRSIGNPHRSGTAVFRKGLSQ